MPRFKVTVVTSKTPEETKTALDAAGFEPGAGPGETHRPGSTDSPTVQRTDISVMVHADTEEAAVAKVQPVVGDDCEVRVDS